jgi:hypothetical protein
MVSNEAASLGEVLKAKRVWAMVGSVSPVSGFSGWSPLVGVRFVQPVQSSMAATQSVSTDQTADALYQASLNAMPRLSPTASLVASSGIRLPQGVLFATTSRPDPVGPTSNTGATTQSTSPAWLNQIWTNWVLPMMVALLMVLLPMATAQPGTPVVSGAPNTVGLSISLKDLDRRLFGLGGNAGTWDWSATGGLTPVLPSVSPTETVDTLTLPVSSSTQSVLGMMNTYMQKINQPQTTTSQNPYDLFGIYGTTQDPYGIYKNLYTTRSTYTSPVYTAVVSAENDIETELAGETPDEA